MGDPCFPFYSVVSVLDKYCPITKQIFLNPVIATDGHVYEKDAFDGWITECGTRSCGMVSPLTKERIEKNSIPILLVKNQIDEWFYIETAFNSDASSPYRQEVYHFYPAQLGFLNLDIDEISDKNNYVGALKENTVLENLTIDKLSKKEKCVCDLTEMIGADISTVSKHLSVLKQAGIVEDERRGLQVWYSLRVPCILSFFVVFY